MLSDLQRDKRDYIVFQNEFTGIFWTWNEKTIKNFKNLNFIKIVSLLDNDLISLDDNIQNSNIKLYDVFQFSQKWFIKYHINFFGHCTMNETVFSGFSCKPRENFYENFECIIDFEKITKKCETYKISKEEMFLNQPINIDDYILV